MAPLSATLAARPFRRIAGPSMSSAQIAVTVVVSGLAGGYAAHSGDWRTAFSLVVLAGLAMLGMFAPATFIAIFLIGRPLLDNTPVSTRAPGAVALVLVAMLIVVMPATRRRVVAPTSTVAFVGVLLVSLVVAVESVMNFPGVLTFRAVSEIARVGSLLAIYLLAATLLSGNLKLLAKIVAFSGVIPALVGLVDLLSGAGQEHKSGFSRINGTFDGPNPFGMYLALSMLVLLSLPKTWVKTWVRLAALVPMAICLVATYSRGGWAMFLIGALLLWARKRPAVVVTIAVIVVTVVFAVPSVNQRVLPKSTSNTAVATPATYDSFSWRLENWRVLLDKWKQRPLLGYGLETTTYVNPRVPVNGKGRSGGGYNAHNIGVRILVEGGVVLLLTYAFMFAVVLRSTFRLMRARWPAAWLARVTFAGWMVILICGLSTGDTLGMTAMMFPLVALTGAVEGAYLLYRRTRRTAPAINA